jgi:hypothetical protein
MLEMEKVIQIYSSARSKENNDRIGANFCQNKEMGERYRGG